MSLITEGTYLMSVVLLPPKMFAVSERAGEQIKVMKEQCRHIYLVFGSRCIFNNYFNIFIFWPCYSPWRILVPQPELKPTPLHWEHGVFATRPPGKSWKPVCFQHVPTHQILSTAPQVRWAVTIGPLLGEERRMEGGQSLWLASQLHPTNFQTPG